jgi:putative lipoic acid-binding regulatory protein
MDLQNRKPEINYPTKWEYKIIGSDVDEMIKAVDNIVKEFDFELVPSNISKKANYFSIKVIVFVPTEEFRDKIFKELTEHPAIKFVI